jgi:tetratricopeptide (TPR) repeat protein
MERWQTDLHRGIRHLSKHDSGGAVLCFTKALQACPVYRTEDLGKVLYYLGIALKRLGLSNSAVRSWIAAHRTKRQRHTQEILKRFANSYGMAKQGCQEQDDWQAFYSMQLLRYLRGFNRRAISDDSERKMLEEVIRSYWERLKAGGALEGRSPAEKSEIFKATCIDFPLFFQGGLPDPVVRVDFASGRKLRPGDRCFCGSGLPYLACCGRTPGADELMIGIF